MVVRERWVQVGRKSPDDLSFVRPSPGRFPLNFLEDQEEKMRKRRHTAATRPRPYIQPPCNHRYKTITQMTTARHVLTKLFHLTLLVLLLQSTFAQKSTPARRRRQKSKNGVIFPETFKTVMKYLVVSLFGPVILYFIYSVVRDPVTPHLCWELSMRCREKLSGNVGEATTRDTTYRKHARSGNNRKYR